jgi:hypothetical protein
MEVAGDSAAYIVRNTRRAGSLLAVAAAVTFEQAQVAGLSGGCGGAGVANARHCSARRSTAGNTPTARHAGYMRMAKTKAMLGALLSGLPFCRRLVKSSCTCVTRGAGNAVAAAGRQICNIIPIKSCQDGARSAGRICGQAILGTVSECGWGGERGAAAQRQRNSAICWM